MPLGLDIKLMVLFSDFQIWAWIVSLINIMFILILVFRTQ